jgi:hypothetical protein
MTKEDVPFAQDFLGNQYILRDEQVMRVMGETAELGPPLPGLTAIQSGRVVEVPALSLGVFIQAIHGFKGALNLELLDQYLKAGHTLDPGDLMHVYPPMCSQEAASGIGLSAIPMRAEKRLDFLASVVRAVRDAGPGGRPSFPLVR